MEDPPTPGMPLGMLDSSKPKNRTFDENYQELLVFKSLHGHTLVPNRYPQDRVLGKWVSHLREYKAANQLSQERIDALDAIGFVWSPHQKRWEDSFLKLKAYQSRFGHCKVPTNWKGDKALGKWVARQREDLNTGIMTDERKARLDAIGFTWSVKRAPQKPRNTDRLDEKWMEKYNELVAFRKQHGHANPTGDNPLSKWIKGQRVIRNRNLMPEDRIKKLEEIGFLFNYDGQKKQQMWNQMYEILKSCQKEDDGGLEISNAGELAPTLSRWMARQRERYKNYALEPGREVLLRKLDFRFPDRPPKEDIDDGNDSSEPAGLGASFKASGVAATYEAAARAPDTPGRKAGARKVFVSGVEIPMGSGGTSRRTGQQIGDSISLLSNFLSISPEEVAARLSRPVNMHELAGNHVVNGPAAERRDLNVFARLMPLIVKLRNSVDAAIGLRDCADFLERLIRREKPDRPSQLKDDDSDQYNRLLVLAVELGNVLDYSDHSRAVVESCEAYFNHVMEKATVRKRAPPSIVGLAEPGKRQRANI